MDTAAAIGDFTQMYSYSILDGTVLHEMTHTYVGGEIDDRKDLKQHPYGWTNCANRPPNYPLEDNAESINLFAVGVWMIMTQVNYTRRILIERSWLI